MVRKDQLPETLDAHFEALTNQGEARARLVEQTPGLLPEAEALFAVARLLWALLQPVQPSTAFRIELGEQLTAAARRKQAGRVLGIGQIHPVIRNLWLVPVAALGTASLVGAYAFWRRSRQDEDEEALAA